MAECRGSSHVAPMKRTLLLAAVALASVSPIMAQDRLSAGARVRLALPQGEVVEGNLLRGDSLSLFVRTDTKGIVEVPRQRVLLITTASQGSSQRALESGATAGGLAALLVGAVTTRCRVGGRCRPSYNAMTVAALLGAGLGSITSAGASAEQWRPVSNSAPVVGRFFGPDGAQSCGGGPSLQLRAGLSGAGSHTGSGALSLFCYQRMSVAAEGGLLRDLVVPSNPFYQQLTGGNYPYNYSASAVREDRRRAMFAGMVGDLELRGPFNPHLLLSVGGYRRTDVIETKTRVFTYTSAPGYLGPTELAASNSATYTMPGIGAGLAVWGLESGHLSAGITARSHYLLGFNGGVITTIEGSARIR